MQSTGPDFEVQPPHLPAKGPLSPFNRLSESSHAAQNLLEQFRRVANVFFLGQPLRPSPTRQADSRAQSSSSCNSSPNSPTYHQPSQLFLYLSFSASPPSRTATRTTSDTRTTTASMLRPFASFRAAALPIRALCSRPSIWCGGTNGAQQPHHRQISTDLASRSRPRQHPPSLARRQRRRFETSTSEQRAQCREREARFLRSIAQQQRSLS